MFNRREFRADVRQVLLSAHGVTVATATRAELANAVQQAAESQAAWYSDQVEFKRLVQDAVRDLFKGKT